jgi:hypothetical protein
MKLTENPSIMATIRECQGKAMDAKAVADRIYREHSILATEEQVLHAQAWLQDELKLNETPPTIEKKTENTAPVTPPSTPPATDTSKVLDDAKVAAVPAGVDAGAKPIIPEGVPKIPPVQVIVDLIRRGYRDRDDLEAYMKVNFEGKSYRDDVREQLQLFKARQPSFNDIPATPPSTRTTASTPPSTPRATAPVQGVTFIEPVREPVTPPPTPPVQATPPATPASSNTPTPATQGTSDPPIAVIGGVADPTTLDTYIRPFLAEGVTYTQLATLVGRNLGHHYTLLLEAVANSIEAYRREGKNAMAIYPLLEEVHHHKFGSLTYTLSQLQLNSDRNFTPNWKNLILCSKPGSIGKGVGSGVGGGVAEVAGVGGGVEDLEGVTTIEQRRAPKLPLFYRLPAQYRTSYWAM